MPELIPTEAAESRLCMQYMKLLGIRFTHVKNETGRPQRGRKVRNWQAVYDAIDGVSAGFPDFVMIIDQVIIVELKRSKGGTLSPKQKEWVEALNAAGTPAYVCRGFAEFKPVIDKHLALLKQQPHG